jgi:hypothetical protein
MDTTLDLSASRPPFELHGVGFWLRFLIRLEYPLETKLGLLHIDAEPSNKTLQPGPAKGAAER